MWDGASIWLYSITRSQRWTNLERDPRVSVLVEAGEDYFELRGAEVMGSVEQVGEVPRTGEACPELAEPERLWDEKYGMALRRPSRVAAAHAAQDRELGLPQARRLAAGEDADVKIAWREIHAGVPRRMKSDSRARGGIVPGGRIMSLVKFLPAWFHAIADYAVGILLIVVALADNGSDGAKATGVVVGAVVLLVSMATRYPLGIVKVLPFTIHSAGDYLAAALLIVAPFVAELRRRPRVAWRRSTWSWASRCSR